MFWNRRRIEARWGVPLPQLLQDMADQGLNRRQAAEALGVTYGSVFKWVSGLDEDPFGSGGVATDWVRDTCVPFGEEVRRLHKLGYNITQAARALGYRNNWGLRYAMRQKGIDVQFDARDRLTIYCDARGVSVEQALARFATLTDAGKAMGYASADGLRQILRARGIDPSRTKVASPKRKKRQPKSEHPWRKERRAEIEQQTALNQ